MLSGPFFEVSWVTPFDVICLSPNDSNLILGSLIPPTPPQIGNCSPQRFPFISYNGGVTLNPLALPPLTAIAIDPGNDNIIYATSGNNIYKSTNRGSSFNVISQIINLTKLLRVSPFNESHLFVSDSLGMQISTNSGLTFARLNVPQFRDMYFYNNKPVVYGVGNGVFKSTDNGMNWIQFSSLNASCIEVNPDDSAIIYIGTNNGVYRSITGGQTFNHSEISFPNSNLILGLSKDANSGDTIIVCTQRGIYKVWDLQTGITKINSAVPEKYSLMQNYPNPFNPETKIRYDIRTYGNVLLNVYDNNGREIETLVNEEQSPGTYEITFNGSSLPSGVYFYKVETGNYFASKKMIVLK